MHPVLLLPGTLCTGSIFERQVKALGGLAPHVEVIQFRRERSIEEMAATVAKRIPPGTSAAVAGFSMGGMVALALARQAADKIARLALINSNHHGDRPERRSRRLGQLATLTDTGLPRLIEEDYLPRYLHRQRLEHRTLIIDMARELGVECFRAQTAALASRPAASDTLRALACPTLIIGSTQDALCPPAVQIEMHRLAPHSDLLLLGDCGHFSTLERPGAVSHALCGWYLSGTAGTEGSGPGGSTLPRRDGR
jgi:pimeloyl-ACP methyl ester carboxylesterase